MAIGHITDTRSRRIAAPFLRDTIPPKQVTADEMAARDALVVRMVERSCFDAPDILAALGLNR